MAWSANLPQASARWSAPFRTWIPTARACPTPLKAAADFFQSQIDILERGIVSLGRDIENLTEELADLRARANTAGADEDPFPRTALHPGRNQWRRRQSLAVKRDRH
jgi:hypothetical protein